MHREGASIHDSRRIALHGTQRAAASHLVRRAHMRRGRHSDGGRQRRLGACGPWRAWWCPSADSAGDAPRRRSSPLRLPARTSECAIAEPENALLCWLPECAEGRAELAELMELFTSAPRRWRGAGRARRGREVRAHGVQRALLGHDGAEALDELSVKSSMRRIALEKNDKAYSAESAAVVGAFREHRRRHSAPAVLRIRRCFFEDVDRDTRGVLGLYVRRAHIHANPEGAHRRRVRADTIRPSNRTDGL